MECFENLKKVAWLLITPLALMVIIWCLCLILARQTVEVEDLSPSGLLLMRVFFHEIIAAGDDASFMEVRSWSVCSCRLSSLLLLLLKAAGAECCRQKLAACSYRS